MGLLRLREQILLAMGITSVAAAQPAPQPAPRPKPPAPLEDRCALQKDTIVEFVCGPSRKATCGPKGNALASVSQRSLYVTKHDGKSLAPFKRWHLDQVETEKHEGSCCYSTCTKLRVTRLPARDVNPRQWKQTCIPVPSGGTAVPVTPDHPCPSAVQLDGRTRPFVQHAGTRCCYGHIPKPTDPDFEEHRPYRGRAARVDGVPQVAAVAPTPAWRSAMAIDTELPSEVRARLAARWLRAAQMEHASVASFAALSLRLLALGAPPELVAGVHAAAVDEVEHARVSFEIASAYANASLGPSPFAEATRLPTGGDLRALAVETLREGIEETTAALEAERAAELARDPAIAAALRTIAADEARHAALAFAIVSWCVRAAGPSLIDDLRAAVGSPRSASPDDDDLVTHGLLTDAMVAALRDDACARIVAPCLDALATAA